MRIIKLTIFPVPVRLHSGSGKLSFVVISPCFAKFKNVVHSLKPGEKPSYPVSHQAPKYVQRYKISQNTLKWFGAIAVRLRLFFLIYLCSVL